MLRNKKLMHKVRPINGEIVGTFIKDDEGTTPTITVDIGTIILSSKENDDGTVTKTWTIPFNSKVSINFNSSKYTDINIKNIRPSSMTFNSNYSLRRMSFENINGEYLTSLNRCFSTCRYVYEFKGFDNIGFPNVRNIDYMFYAFGRYKDEDNKDIYPTLGRLKFPKINSLYCTFENSRINIENIKFWDLRKIITYVYSWDGNGGTRIVDLRKTKLKLNSLFCFFYRCTDLEEFYFPEDTNWSIIKSARAIFSNCSSIVSIDLSKLGQVTDIFRGFSNCVNLEYLDISNIDLTQCDLTGTGSSCAELFMNTPKLLLENIKMDNCNEATKQIIIDKWNEAHPNG